LTNRKDPSLPVCHPGAARARQRLCSTILFFLSPLHSVVPFSPSLGPFFPGGDHTTSGTALIRSSSGASSATSEVCLPIPSDLPPFPHPPAVRNRTVQTLMCGYLNSDLTMYFTCYLRFFCKNYRVWMCTSMSYAVSAPGGKGSSSFLKILVLTLRCLPFHFPWENRILKISMPYLFNSSGMVKLYVNIYKILPLSVSTCTD
jgi:hypothetical protein